jgi:hypothetical protein
LKALILHEGGSGIDVCAHTKNPQVRAKFEKEHNNAQKLKEQRSNIGSDTRFVANGEPTIVHETRKRKATLVEEESSKPPITGQENKLVKMLNIQGREDIKTRVARVIYALWYPF